MKNNWVSLLALGISVLALIFVSFHVEVTVTHETFIGIMASFMGAAATIIVGAQIYNSVESNKKLARIEVIQIELNQELNNAKNERKRNELIMQSGIYRAHAISLLKIQPFTTYLKLFNSLELALQANENELISSILQNMYAVCRRIENTENKQEIRQTHVDNILQECSLEKLEGYEQYPLIKDRYQKIFKEIEACILDIKKLNKLREYDNPSSKG